MKNWKQSCGVYEHGGIGIAEVFAWKAKVFKLIAQEQNLAL